MPVNITKNGREHTFPLGTLSLKLLQVSTATTGILFPGKSLSPFNGWSKVKAALDTASGVTDGTLHDLRRTFATNLAQLGGGAARHYRRRLRPSGFARVCFAAASSHHSRQAAGPSRATGPKSRIRDYGAGEAMSLRF